MSYNRSLMRQMIDKLDKPTKPKVPRNQWQHPGEVTRVDSPYITMEGVDWPVLGISDTNHMQMMYPGQHYTFDGSSVTEYPMMGDGGEMIRRADGSYSRRGLWDNIRANKGSGKKPTKQILEQERKIKRSMQVGGEPPVGFHQMPDGTIMADEAHYNNGGMYADGGTLNSGTLINNKNMYYNPSDYYFQKGGSKKVKPKGGYIDIKKSYGLDPLSKEGILKAQELEKLYPGTKFICNEKGCAAIAGKAARAFGDDFGYANAWDFGNQNDVEYQNPAYEQYMENVQGPLPNPKSFKVPSEVLQSKGRLVGLNRYNNNHGGMAKTKDQANDSFDYANPELYPGTRGYEHVGYTLGDNILLHGTGAASNHPSFYILDNMKNGINLSGYGQYEPVEMMSPDNGFFSKLKRALFQEGGEEATYQDGGSFSSSFANARKQGLKTFTWNGKSYSTQMAGESSSGQRATVKKANPMSNMGKVAADVPAPPIVNPRMIPPVNPVNTAGSDTLAQIGAASNARMQQRMANARLPQREYTEKDVAELKKRGFKGNMKEAANLLNQIEKVQRDYSDFSTNTGTDVFRAMSPLPHNMDQNVLWYANRLLGVGNNKLSDKNLSEEQRYALYAAAQRAMKKNNNPYHGGIVYSNYGDDIREQAVEGKGSFTDKIKRSFTDPNFEMSHTIGGGNYWNDPSSDYMYVTDSYDFNGKMGKDGKPQPVFAKPEGTYQNYRNWLATMENYNPTEDEMADRKTMIRFNKKEMEGLKKKYPQYTYKGGGSTYSDGVWFEDGGIYINPANRGKFTASAQAAGMGVQEFASHVLGNREDYSPTIVKRANFARNASKWKHQYGGIAKGDVLEVSPEQAEQLRKQGYQFEII